MLQGTNQLNSRTVTSGVFSGLGAKLVTFPHLKREFHQSNILAFYKIQSRCCNATYYGKTKYHLVSECVIFFVFFVLIWREIALKLLTLDSLGNRLKVIMILPQMNTFYFDFEDLSILTTNKNAFKVSLMDNNFINRDHLPLNKSKQSLPLNTSYILRGVPLSHEFYM